MTGTLGAPWKATDDIWRRLEAAYGEQFDDELKKKIEIAIQKYFDWAGAPAARDFANKLITARKLAIELGEVVSSFGEPRIFVAPHWERYFPREEERTADGPIIDDDKALWDWVIKQPIRRERHRCFSEMVHIIYSALDDTLREVSSSDVRKQSQITTWKELIANLAHAFRSKGLKVSASKDQDRPLSPFVRFVKELQSMFAEDFWRPSSDAALSEAIHEITKIKGKKKKTGVSGLLQRKQKPSNTARKRV
jgi:hypothetical protein